MSSCVQTLKDLAWSDLCLTDLSAYRSYLDFLTHGFGIIATGHLDGSVCLLGSECSRSDNDISVKSSAILCKDARGDCLVDRDSACCATVGTESDVDSGLDASRLAIRSRGLSVVCADSGKCGVAGSGNNAVVESARDVANTAVDGQSMANGELVTLNGEDKLHKNRASRKKKKARRSAAIEASNGVWNCDNDLRAELANTRAKVFIARNRKELRAHDLDQRLYNDDYGFASKLAGMSKRLGGKSSDVGEWASSVMIKAVESIASGSGCDEPYSRSTSCERKIDQNWRDHGTKKSLVTEKKKNHLTRGFDNSSHLEEYLDEEAAVPCRGVFHGYGDFINYG